MATTKKAPAKRTALTPSKKAATKKAATKPKPVAPLAWNTIHVFGYGESQVIGSKANGKVANSNLKSLATLFSSLAKKQQKGTKVSIDDNHALNIVNGSFVDFRPRDMKNAGQRFAWEDVDVKAIGKFADELMGKVSKGKKQGNFMELFTAKKPVLAKGAQLGTKRTAATKVKKNTSARAKK